MQFFKSTALFTLLASIVSAAPQAAATTYCQPKVVTTWEQEQIYNRFANTFYYKKDVKGAFTEYVTADYIQHSYNLKNGPQSTIATLSPIFPNVNISVLHLSFDSGIAYGHAVINAPQSTPLLLVDVFRMNGSCIQEHWGLMESLPANNTNPIAGS